MNELPALTSAELERFKICKEGIADHWYHASVLLKEIRDDKLYRAEYATFVEFCEAELNIGKSEAYRRIEAVDAVAAISDLDGVLPEDVCKALQINKKMSPRGDVLPRSQVFALAKVPKEDRPAVLVKAASAGPITAASIKVAAVEEPPDDVRDMEGFRVPEEALAAWNRRDEPKAFMSEVSRMKCFFERAHADHDAFWHGAQNMMMNLQSVYSALTECIPYAVCTSCDGRPSKQPHGGCGTCRNTGVIGKFQWQQCSRIEIKSKREKIIAGYKKIT